MSGQATKPTDEELQRLAAKAWRGLEVKFVFEKTRSTAWAPLCKWAPITVISHRGEDTGAALVAALTVLAGEPAPEPREIVICAAIRLPDGKIFRGHRHGDCIETAHKFVTWNGGVEPGDHHWTPDLCSDQGFVTSRNRYVGREEGLRLQLAAGIPSACPSGYRAWDLFSEDLY